MDTPLENLAIAVSPSGKRIRIKFMEVAPGDWRVYRQTEPFNWNITVGRKWPTRAEALAYIEGVGYTVITNED